jgi:hypothetical protein
MRKYFFSCTLAIAMAALLIASAPTQAASAAMPEGLDNGGARLRLATPAWSDGALQIGLYAATPLAARAEFVRGSTAPRSLRLVMLRTLSADQFGLTLMRRVDQAGTSADVAAQTGPLLRIGEAFSARRALAAGDTVSFEFAPGRGTRVLINDAPASAYVGDAALFALLARPWSGAAAATAEPRATITTVAFVGR